MQNLTRFSAIVVGLLGATGAVALVACGNDATGIVDGGGLDAQGDGMIKPDARHDAGTDARPDSRADVGAPDSTADVTHPPDGPTDTGTDAHTDVVDSGRDAPKDGDSGFDTGPETDFLVTLVTAYCTKMQSCCALDGGAFSISDCVTSETDSFALPTTDLGLIFGAAASPHHTFDPAKAATCLADLQGLSCGANSAGALNNVSTACSAVYAGLLGQGDVGCRSSFDCVSGTYCGPINSDGITTAPDGGTCLPTGGLNSPCVDIDYSSDCTYLGSGSPGFYCNVPYTDAGVFAASGVCAQSQLTGTDCSSPGYPEQCVTQICTFDSTETVGTCAASELFTAPSGTDFCSAFAP